MYILLNSGGILNVGDKLEYSDIVSIVNESGILELTKMPDTHIITNETVLHNCWKDHVYLEPGYTFDSFIKMLAACPVFKQFKLFAESHYLKYLQTDLNYVENPISAVMCILKVTNAWQPDLEYRESMQLRCFEYNGSQFDVYSKYSVFKNDKRLTYEWIEENGYSLLGMVPWEKLATCPIELSYNFTGTYRDNMHISEYPGVTLFEFVTTILDNTCNCYVEDMDSRNKMLSGEDEEIDD